MNIEKFWTIIEQSRSVLSDSEIDGNFDRQAEYIKQELRNSDKSSIVEFQRIYHQLVQDLYTWDLWGAAYVIAGGCSDDGFTDFRAWIISLGKERYELALKDPDELGPVSLHPSVEDTFFEELGYVADDVYEELFNEELAIDFDYLEEPKGKRWNEESVEEMYPNLSAIYAS